MYPQSDERRLVYGVGSIMSAREILDMAGSRNPMIVTDSTTSGSTFYKMIEEQFEHGFGEFREITTGPPLPEVEHLTESFRNKNCDSIISVGGDSVIWAGKLLKHYFAHDAYHLAVPTTLTLSSFSDWAEYRIGDETYRESGRKMIPDAVITDPRGSIESDSASWYFSGFGIMTYAISNLSRQDIGPDVSDLLLSSLEGMMVNLSGNSMESRLECHLSSWYSFDQSHSFATDSTLKLRDQLLRECDICEEVVSALLLPVAAKRCVRDNPDIMAQLAKRLGFRGDDTGKLAKGSFELIQGLMAKVSVSNILGERGIGLEDVKSMLEKASIEKEDSQAVIESIYGGSADVKLH